MYSMVLMAALTSGSTAPDLFGKHRGTKHHVTVISCYGGCYGGCNGSCYGCGGGACYGGWNNCYGTCAGGWGIHGYGAFGCHGCYGCYGCYGCTGFAPGHVPNLSPNTPIPGDHETLPAPKKANGDKATLAPNKARLLVELPAEAKLTIDGQEMKTVSGRGSFTTPALQKDETYYYELTVELLRDGKPISQTRRVLVRAGEEVQANFTDLDPVRTARSE